MTVFIEHPEAVAEAGPRPGAVARVLVIDDLDTHAGAHALGAVPERPPGDGDAARIEKALRFGVRESGQIVEQRLDGRTAPLERNDEGLLAHGRSLPGFGTCFGEARSSDRARLQLDVALRVTDGDGWTSADSALAKASRAKLASSRRPRAR